MMEGPERTATGGPPLPCERAEPSMPCAPYEDTRPESAGGAHALTFAKPTAQALAGGPRSACNFLVGRPFFFLGQKLLSH